MKDSPQSSLAMNSSKSSTVRVAMPKSTKFDRDFDPCSPRALQLASRRKALRLSAAEKRNGFKPSRFRTWRMSLVELPMCAISVDSATAFTVATRVLNLEDAE